MNQLQMPLHQFLGLILGEQAKAGPMTSMEMFKRLNGQSTHEDDAEGYHGITLPMIRWAHMQLERRGCCALHSNGWKFMGWPTTGGFGHIDEPSELIARAVETREDLLVKLAPSDLVQQPTQANLVIQKTAPRVTPQVKESPPLLRTKQQALFS